MPTRCWNCQRNLIRAATLIRPWANRWRTQEAFPSEVFFRHLPKGSTVVRRRLFDGGVIRPSIEGTSEIHFHDMPDLTSCTIPDMQAAWLLLLMCAAPNCHYLFLALPRSSAAAFARSYDEATLACLRGPLGNDSRPRLDALATRTAQLPLHIHGRPKPRARRYIGRRCCCLMPVQSCGCACRVLARTVPLANLCMLTTPWLLLLMPFGLRPI